MNRGGFKRGKHGRASRSARTRQRLFCERLEERALLASPGYDYLFSGFRWQNPTRITYSIAPDGVFWDHGVDNLNTSFNAKFGTNGTWQREIARALATWQSVANVNIVQVADGNFNLNTLGKAQGDTRFGDIRVGGYAFSNAPTTLAQTYFPPPNGSTAAGDVELNTSMNFNIGTTYDLYSVVLHETGHSLGLDHPSNTSVVMAPNYGGLRTGLTPGDIAGIQSIYGARTLDPNQAQGRGLGFTTAIDVSAGLVGSNQTVSSAAWLASIGSAEYFTVTAPAYASGKLQVTAAANGSSLLSPKVSIYDASGKLITQASNPSAWGNDVTATVQQAVPGTRYYVVVSGATGDVFDVGAYQLKVTLPGSIPTPQPPTTPTPPPSVQPPWSWPIISPPSSVSVIAPDRFEPNNTFRSAKPLGRVNQTTIAGLNLSSGQDLDYFRFQTNGAGSLQVTANGTVVQVFNARGRLIASGMNQVNLWSASRNATYLVRVMPPANAPVSGYSFSAVFQPLTMAQRRRVTSPRRIVAGSLSSMAPIAQVGQSSQALSWGGTAGLTAVSSKASRVLPVMTAVKRWLAFGWQRRFDLIRRTEGVLHG